MPELPRIPSKKPITEPAVPERTFPDLFATYLQIRAKPGGRWPTVIVMQPYNKETGELGPAENAIRYDFDDVLGESDRRAADEKPTLLQALGAVMAAFVEIANEMDDEDGDGIIEIKEPE